MDFLKNGIDFLRHEMLILQGELNVHTGLGWNSLHQRHRTKGLSQDQTHFSL